MTYADLINGGFEVIGGLLVLNHCRAVLKDKAVAGVSVVSVVMFTGWGFWNAVWYYPSLDQWASFAGGLVIVAANICWVALLLRYRKRPTPA